MSSSRLPEPGSEKIPWSNAAKAENGYLKLRERPGIRFEAQNALYAVMRELTGKN